MARKKSTAIKKATPARRELAGRLNLTISVLQQIHDAIDVSHRNIFGGYEQTASVLSLAAEAAGRLQEELAAIKEEVSHG